MTEKVFKQSEIEEQVKRIYSNYLKHYANGKMEFKEVVLIEHFILILERDLGIDLQ